MTEATFAVAALSARYLQAVEMGTRAQEYFRSMGNGIASELRTKWEQEIGIAESERMNNAAAMDILGASARPSGQARTSESSFEYSDAEKWIQMAIDHERMQWVACLVCRSGN